MTRGTRAEPPGFAEFVAARGPSLVRTAMLLTHDYAAAEDLVQTALAKAWPKWERAEQHEAYVRTIIVHEFARGWRRKWRGELPTGELPEEHLPDATDRVAVREDLMRALATLPPKQRAVIVLRYFHDYTEADIASALGISAGTVKVARVARPGGPPGEHRRLRSRGERIMTSSTDELREAMQAYAEDVPSPDAGSLIDGAQRKRDHARKVRVAVVAGAAAVLMAVVTVIGLQGIGREKALTPAQLNKKYHTHYPGYTHGLKLANIVEVPVRKVPDTDSSATSAPANAAAVSLPRTGSLVYVLCNSRYFMNAADMADTTADPTVEGRHVAGPGCSTITNPMFATAEPGAHDRWWVDTADNTTNDRAPVAIYTQVPWNDYPTKSTALHPRPAALDVKQPAYGTYAFVISGSGSHSATRTFRVPAKADLLGAALTIAPSSTGRFQVLIDGHAQELDYNGSPLKQGFVGFGPPPEVRGTWFDYFPDSAALNSPGVAKLRTPPAGTSFTVTIRAADTTGPWKAMLSWQKK